MIYDIIYYDVWKLKISPRYTLTLEFYVNAIFLKMCSLYERGRKELKFKITSKDLLEDFFKMLRSSLSTKFNYVPMQFYLLFTTRQISPILAKYFWLTYRVGWHTGFWLVLKVELRSAGKNEVFSRFVILMKTRLPQK